MEAARKQGLQEGQAQANRQPRSRHRSRNAAAVHRGGARVCQHAGRYFRRVEIETVRLALAIARKVLHREAQMDPLLLAGVVRVALDQMQAGTRVVLRTSPGSAPGWARVLRAALRQSKHAVEVVPDSALEGHRCILEAEMGSTEISLDSQLQEIESGFFDLLREASRSTSHEASGVLLPYFSQLE